jgi:excisionase family DNA binding protein
MVTRKKSAKKRGDKPALFGFSLSSLMSGTGADLDPAAGLDDPLLTVTEAAKLTGVSRVAIHERISRGRLNAVDIGGRKFIRRSELDAFERQKPGPKGDTE